MKEFLAGNNEELPVGQEVGSNDDGSASSGEDGEGADGEDEEEDE